MAMETRVVTMPDQSGAGILHVGPFDSLGADFDRLGAWMSQHRADLRGAPRCVYLDDPQATPAEQLRTWVAVPVADSLVLIDQDSPVVACPFPGGQYLVGVHRGSYAGLAGAWAQLIAVMASGGHQPDWTRPGSEIYLSDPSTTPEDELLTELYQPIN